MMKRIVRVILRSGSEIARVVVDPRRPLRELAPLTAALFDLFVNIVDLVPIFFQRYALRMELTVLKRKLSRATESRRRPPSLKRLANFADFWGFGLRKRIKAVAGEFDVELKRLHKEKRYGTAKWNVVLAWGYAIWYVLRGPYDMLKGALVKALRGL